MEAIDRVKTLLHVADNKQDSVLKEIEQNTRSLYSFITGAEKVPEEHEFMIVEVMVRRFNRIGSEGMSSQSVEGLSQSFSSADFDEYLDLLVDYHDLKPKSGVKFI